MITVMKRKIQLFSIVCASTLLTACGPDTDIAGPQTEFDKYAESFKQMIGGEVDKRQNWVTGTVIEADVTTSKPALVSVYTLGKETRSLYAQKTVDGRETFKFDIPQNADTRIAFEADYGEHNSVYRMMKLNLDLKQTASIDLKLNAGSSPMRSMSTRGAMDNMQPTNSVQNPNSRLCGESNQSTDGGYAGHHFGYTSFPGWSWDNIAKAVPETSDPKKNGQITNYELISTGPFYLSLLYGCTGTYDQTILGYYYYKEKGNYTDLVMVDLMDVLRHDYVDGYAKVQYQLNGENQWHDANFDYKDGDGLGGGQVTSQTARRGDDAYNTLLVNQKYGGAEGIQTVRGITFQVNVPVGYRLGFYLKKGQISQGQKKRLQELGVPEECLKSNMALSFSGADLNVSTNGRPYKSVIQKYDGYTFMGLDDNPTAGDSDCNDVTFGLTAGNGGSLPGVLLPGVMDLDTNKYYNTDGTITDEPTDDYVKNVIEGRDPFDYGEAKPEETPGETEVKDLIHWTMAFEDMGTIGDFDFNDVVIKIVPNTAQKAKVYLLATGGSINSELHYIGPNGDQKLCSVHNILGSMTNTKGEITKEAKLVAEVDWPYGFVMPEDAHRFYIVAKGKKVAISTEPGQVPEALCVQGDWKWPTENTSIEAAYPLVGEWAKDLNNSEARDWYKHPNNDKVVK